MRGDVVVGWAAAEWAGEPGGMTPWIGWGGGQHLYPPGGHQGQTALEGRAGPWGWRQAGLGTGWGSLAHVGVAWHRHG